jgi:hypothetical protein
MLSDREEYFDEEFYQHRFVIERTFSPIKPYSYVLRKLPEIGLTGVLWLLSQLFVETTRNIRHIQNVRSCNFLDKSNIFQKIIVIRLLV